MTTLEDLRILDLSDSAAGAYCAALFAGYGADVIAIEPPGGSLVRAEAAWARLGAGKRSVTLDVRTEIGQRLFRKMVEQSNVVIETFEAGTMESLGLGFGDLYGVKRRIILTSIAPAPDLGPDAATLAGLNAFAAAAIATHNADAYEVPQHIVISIAECAALAVDGSGAMPAHPPFAMSEVEWVDAAAPEPGEHSLEFYAGELGLAEGEVAELRAVGAV